MRLRKLGNSALKVSEVSLGTWLSIGGESKDRNTPGSPSVHNRETGLQILETAVDEGIIFFDTAPGYGKGNAERMLGEFFKKQDRDDFVIATKVFFPIRWNDNFFGNSKKSIHINLKNSLERLQTDYVDVYYCHVYDNMGKIEETIKAMNHMIDQGKILHWAASNWTAAEIERVYGICKAEGLQPPIVLQTKYNLMKREIELSHLSTIDYTKIGIVAYSPLEEGVLTGKYNHGKPAEHRFEKVKGTEFDSMESEFLDKVLTDENIQKLRKLEEIAKEQEITMAQLSLAWLLSKGYVSTVLTGASKAEHVKSNAEASRMDLDEDIITRVEEVMDNEPVDQGDHARWGYNRIKKVMQRENYRMGSISFERKKMEKEKAEKKE